MDYLVRGMTEDGEFRFVAACTTETSNEARRRHATASGASRLLSETMTAASLLSTPLSGEEKLSLQITSNGPVRGVMADADANGNLRGFISNPQVYADLPDAPGGPPPLGREGTILVIRSTPLKVLSRGTVPLFAGEVGSDVGAYLTQSEQVFSAMALHAGFLPDRAIANACGILIQALPGASLEKFDAYKAVLDGQGGRASILHDGSTPELAIETLMNAVAHESPYRILQRADLRFQCACSREKVVDTLRMIGAEELQKMRAEDGQAEVVCRFCNEHYRIDRAELDVLLATFHGPKN